MSDKLAWCSGLCLETQWQGSGRALNYGLRFQCLVLKLLPAPSAHYSPSRTSLSLAGLSNPPSSGTTRSVILWHGLVDSLVRAGLSTSLVALSIFQFFLELQLWLQNRVVSLS